MNLYFQFIYRFFLRLAVPLQSLLTLTFITMFCAASHAAEPMAELIWVEHGETHQILHSEYLEGNWTNPLLVYESDNYLNSIALSTLNEGEKILVFSEYLKTRKVLKSITRPAVNSEWSDALLLSDFGMENLAASLVLDIDGVLWLFWAANKGDLDDIYLSKMTQKSWSRPIKVNMDNDVPDINPVASLNENAEVEVEWQTYSFDVGGYVTTKHVFELDKERKNRYKAAVLQRKEVSFDDLSLPKYLPDRSLALIHFPSNLLQQSQIIDLN